MPVIMTEPSASLLPVRYLPIDETRAGQRLDNFLLAVLQGLPRTRLYKLLREGQVRVNKKRVAPSYRLVLGDTVRLPPMQLPLPGEIRELKISETLATLITTRILLETDDLLVLNKPSGMAVHGGSGLRFGVIEAVRALRPQQKFLELAHRLDKETSGCLLIAKSRTMLVNLNQLLRDNEVKKTYLALVHGRWPRHLHRVDAPLLKNELASGERVVRVRAEGKESSTTFNIRHVYADVNIPVNDGCMTLIEAHPITGRTHQIRVHAAHAGHPLVNDDKYGDSRINATIHRQGLKRLFLHAAKIQFTLPGESERLVIEAPLDADLQAYLDFLESGY